MEKSFPCRQPRYSDTSKQTLSNPVICSGQLNQTINAQQSTNQVREGHFCLKFFQPSKKGYVPGQILRSTSTKNYSNLPS